MNHQVRNALQIISAASYGLDGPQQPSTGGRPRLSMFFPPGGWPTHRFRISLRHHEMGPQHLVHLSASMISSYSPRRSGWKSCATCTAIRSHGAGVAAGRVAVEQLSPLRHGRARTGSDQRTAESRTTRAPDPGSYVARVGTDAFVRSAGAARALLVLYRVDDTHRALIRIHPLPSRVPHFSRLLREVGQPIL
jgi:hypothetical protein